jgi:hypothetical protein
VAISRAQLWTHADNVRAQRLYERRAFRRSGREKADDLDGTIVALRARALAAGDPGARGRAVNRRATTASPRLPRDGTTVVARLRTVKYSCSVGSPASATVCTAGLPPPSATGALAVVVEGVEHAVGPGHALGLGRDGHEQGQPRRGRGPDRGPTRCFTPTDAFAFGSKQRSCDGLVARPRRTLMNWKSPHALVRRVARVRIPARLDARDRQDGRRDADSAGASPTARRRRRGSPTLDARPARRPIEATPPGRAASSRSTCPIDTKSCSSLSDTDAGKRASPGVPFACVRRGREKHTTMTDARRRMGMPRS